jgi:hypothetical protein
MVLEVEPAELLNARAKKPRAETRQSTWTADQ